MISFCVYAQGGVGINNPTPHASALLDLTSTNKGLLTPRMTTAQRTAIASPASGLLVFDTTVNSFYYYNGTAWVTLTSGASGWALSGNSGTNPASNYVGTNDLSPLAFRIGLVNAGRLDFANTWFGFQSGNTITSGTQNSFYGTGSGMSTTTGANNTFIGTGSGISATTGSNNTFLGTDAGYNHGTGSGNTLIGRSAGYNNGSGTNNTYVGSGAGGVANLTNASALGSSAVVSTSNSLVLGGTGANAVKVGIGTTAPLFDLDIHDAGQAVVRVISGSSPLGTAIELRNNAAGQQLLGALNFVDGGGNYLGQSAFHAQNGFTWRNQTVEMMRLMPNGNLGINTTAPASKVHVSLSSAGYAPNANAGFTLEANGNVYADVISGSGETGVLFGSSANATNGGIIYNSGATTDGMQLRTGGNATRMTITSSGNVGVGTTSPAVKFEVVDGNWVIPMRVRNTLAGGYSLTQYINDNNLFGHIGWGNSSSPTFANQFYVGTKDAAPMLFTTNDVERMRLDVAGNLGIGTAAPAFSLDIASTAQAVERITSSAAPTGSVVELKNATAGTNTLGAINFNDAANSYPGQVAYHPTGGLTLRSGGTARVAVMPNGRVGMGTTTPNADLEVNGYTMMGSTAPAVKMLKLTSTTSSVQGGAVAIPHGVNGTKILAVNVYVEYATNNFLPSGYSQNPGYEFNFLFNTTNITVFNTNTNSANILSKPIKVLITYEQ